MKKALQTIAVASAICMMSVPAQAGFFDIFKSDKDKTTYHEKSMWRETRMLESSKVRELQESLADRGFYRGSIDGLWGPQTTAAVYSYERSLGMTPDGILTTTDLRDLGVTVAYSENDVTGIEPAAGGNMDYSMSRDEYVTTYIEQVDIVKYGNSGHARGAQAFME